jgi:hypothetical protein
VTLLIPSVLVLSVFLILVLVVSPIYFFLLGTLFGVPAGYLEKLGWAGYSFPKKRSQNNALAPVFCSD